jgi:serine/threonine protein kinase
MTAERETLISTLVDSTFDLSLEQLRSFLDRECANDPELRAEVERRIFDRETRTSSRTPSGPRPDSLTIGAVVAGRYRISRLIGRGGMGEVYEADDLLMKEAVAIKTLRADLAADQALVEGFQQEIYLARKVTHPNVCRVYEVGLHPSVTLPPGEATSGTHVERAPLLFFAMELLRGETLAARISRRPLTRAEAFPIAEQLAEGLQAAHRAGIVHADFKSANVILVPSDGGVRAVITDFGVARLDPSRTSLDGGRALPEHMRLAGTLAYMSPEQMAGDAVAPAWDIYAFGIVLFEMASGGRPFDERDLFQAIMLRRARPQVAIRTRVPDIDRRWEGAIDRCLQHDPRRRFTSAGELAAWFRGGWLRPVRYWTTQDWARSTAAACAIAVTAGGGWMWTNRPYRPAARAERFYDIGQAALHAMTYETARQALEQAVAIDPAFALAHASLARAYDELDYTDRAKDSMLRAVAAAQESHLTQDDERRLRALQFMVSRDYARARPLIRQLEADAPEAARAAAALEAGWLAQQMDDSTEAAAAFERALSLDPSYAAATLRLGFLLGRQGGRDDQALVAFDEAERLYRVAGNTEGVTQTLLERANLLDRRNREAEALPVIDRALTTARGIGNRFQEVRLQFLQATALRDLGDTLRATAITREAIDRALAENMDNLAANGLIDLGNISLRSGDLAAAEPHFRRALDTARRGRVRRIEARAQVSLGSLYEQEGRPEEARQSIEPGLAFYRGAGYLRESVQAAVVLGGVLRQLGQYDEGIRVLRETAPLAAQLKDARVEALLRERLADALRDRGDWPAALAEYSRAIQLHGPVVQAEIMRVAAASLLRQLGQREDAERDLLTAEQFAARHPNASLVAAIRAEQAEMAYADQRLDHALTLARQLAPGPDDDDVARRARLIEARVDIRRRQIADGLATARRTIQALEQAALAGEAAAAKLSVAEAFATVGARAEAASMVRDALTYFEPRQVWEAVWRAHVIASRVSDGAEAASHRAGGASALARLRQAWSVQTVDRYLTRRDVGSLVDRLPTR